MKIDKPKRFYIIFIALLSVPKHIFFFKTNTLKNIFFDVENTEMIDRNQKFSILKIVRLVRFLIFILQFSKNCFLRSYVTFKVLRCLGINANFKVGVSKDDEFKSHSWLEIDNFLLEENLANIQSMSVIYSLKK